MNILLHLDSPEEEDRALGVDPNGHPLDEIEEMEEEEGSGKPSWWEVPILLVDFPITNMWGGGGGGGQIPPASYASAISKDMYLNISTLK